MNSLADPRVLELTPALSPMVRLQYETAQDSWVLLYPGGTVRFNGPASEILQRCDGRHSVQQMVNDLQEAFGESDLRDDVCAFVSDAYERGWLV